MKANKKTLKKPKTYLIKTENIDDEYIDKTLSKTKLKKASKTQKNVSYLYVYGKYVWDKNIHTIKADLKNLVNDKKKIITEKNSLMNELLKYPEAKEFILKQYNLDLLTFKKNKKQFELIKKLYTTEKKYILKPVSGFSGLNITIPQTFDELLNYITKIEKQYIKRWNKKISYMRHWVLQEYLNDPLLFKYPNTTDNLGYKFHIRHYLCYIPNKESYFIYDGIIIPALKPYKKSDYSNKDIHDTHYYNRNIDYKFPQTLNLSKNRIINIYAQIYKLYNIIIRILEKNNTKCYSENKYCYEIFGVDLFIDKDYKIKLIEVNNKIGLPSIKLNISKILFNGAINKIVLPLLGEKESDSTYTLQYINLSKPLKPQLNKIHLQKN